MSIKFKLVWWIVVALYGLALFVGAPLPHDWGTTFDWFWNVDAFLITHHISPTSVGLFVALLIGTIVVPEAWGVLRRHLEFMEAKELSADELPQLGLHELAVYLRSNSAWGWRELWRFNFIEQVEHHIPEEIRRAAISGEIRMVGTSRLGGELVRTAAIDRGYWRHARIDSYGLFDPQWRRCSIAENPTELNPNYEYLTVPQIDVEKCWPPASLLRKIGTRMAMAAYFSWVKYLKFQPLGVIPPADVRDQIDRQQRAGTHPDRGG